MADNWWADEEKDQKRSFANPEIAPSKRDWWADEDNRVKATSKEAKNTEEFGRLAVSPQRLLALAKGIPVAGQFLPEPNLAQSDPATNTGLNIAGGVMAMGKPSAAVSSKLASAGLPGILPEMAGQSALGVGTNVADKVAQKGFDVTKDDIKNSGIAGIMQGIAGPLLGKAISPGFNSNRYTVEQLAKLSEEELHKVLGRNATKDTVSAILNHPLATGVTGAALSMMTGAAHPAIGALVGAAAPSTIRGVHKVMSNKLMHDVDTQAILNALSHGVGMNSN